ncbi:Hypothetical_protein [Hexamita inflata]|uniref:Hypothetical_protein n=1 Tax=Hexamita inflata TaxID=28002 RepID=A0AA86UHL9_9EUKA|nr:Hypothetical protein HINF_LOCUS39092 [Hexamita inflata]
MQKYLNIQDLPLKTDQNDHSQMDFTEPYFRTFEIDEYDQLIEMGFRQGEIQELNDYLLCNPVYGNYNYLQEDNQLLTSYFHNSFDNQLYINISSLLEDVFTYDCWSGAALWKHIFITSKQLNKNNFFFIPYDKNVYSYEGLYLTIDDCKIMIDKLRPVLDLIETEILEDEIRDNSIQTDGLCFQHL